MKDLRFGIEIETVGASYGALAQAIYGVVGGQVRALGEVVDPQGRVWKLVPDGSLRSDNQYSAEFVSPILRYEDVETLQNAVRAMHRAGARTNASCGIHIHVEAASLGVKGLVNLAKLVHQQEDLIVQALGIQTARLARYTRKLPTELLRLIEERRPRTMEELSRAWYGRFGGCPSRYDGSRYHGCNLNSVFFRGTVEFRWFEGTLHAGKVKAYLQFCLALMAKARSAKAAVSRKRALESGSARYDFRVFLLRLGMIGDEFKTARLHLLGALHGSAAWKRGRPTGGGSGGALPSAGGSSDGTQASAEVA